MDKRLQECKSIICPICGTSLLRINKMKKFLLEQKMENMYQEHKALFSFLKNGIIILGR